MLIVSYHRRNCPNGRTQGRHTLVKHDRFAAVLVVSTFLTGCSSGASINPVDWWHSLEGGPLADARPPPPNADAPYPNLGSVPPKPVPPDVATRNTLSSGLVADRANAQYGASLVPIQPFAPYTAPKPPTLAPQAAGADDETMGAKMAAASAPPQPLGPPQPPLPPVAVTPPRAAPVASVAAAPLTPPPAPKPAASAPPPAAASAPSTQTATAGDLAVPGLPDQPPGQPAIPGVDLPKVAPTPPAPTPIPAAAPPAPIKPGDPVPIAFIPGSAALPTSAQAALKALAQRRGSQPIAVVGYGDAASDQAADQSAALPLALARAQSIAANLQAAGVPAANLRIDAVAQGHGGAARIIAP